MTHAEARKRNERIADQVGNGASVRQAMKKYSVSFTTVQRACLAHGVVLSVTPIRDKQRARRKRMAAEVQKGKSLREVAKKYKVTCQTISQVCEQHGVAPSGWGPGHKKRRDCRQRIAHAIEAGGMVSTVAQRYRVSISTVYSACHEFKVVLPARRPPGTPFSSWAVLGDLYHGRGTRTDIAKRHRISISLVSNMATKARAHGIPIPGPNKRKKR